MRERLFAALRALTPLDLAQVATLLLLAIHYGEKALEGRVPWTLLVPLVGWVVGGLMLSALRRQVAFWGLLALAYALGLSQVWETVNNHDFLTLYWLVALSMVPLLGPEERPEALAANASRLIGLVMAFAVLQKLLSPEYLSGDFFLYTFVTERRFSFVGALVGADMKAIAHENNALIRGMQVHLQPVALSLGPPAVAAVAQVVTWFTLLIEVALSVVFLAPRDSRLARGRDPLLLGFALAVYPLVPVTGFGLLLMTLGLAQARPEHRWRQGAYIACWLYISLVASSLKGWVFGV